MPLLIRNPGPALVQACWEFMNADECLLTRTQEMSIDYHFKVFVTDMSRTEDNMQLTVSQTEDNMQLTEGARSKSFVVVSRATSRVGCA